MYASICEKKKAHKGMLSSAKYIKKELEDYGILDKAFAMYPEYSLVLAGNFYNFYIFHLLIIHVRIKSCLYVIFYMLYTF